MLQTDRLRIRPFRVSDAPFILALLNTPGWLQYIGDRGVTNTCLNACFLPTNNTDSVFTPASPQLANPLACADSPNATTSTIPT